ncbi:MAG: WbqC family protein [Tannerella sp.]|nr:WbqC family protein [Tannerella sp.]
MHLVYLSTAYLAPVQYFSKLVSSDEIQIEIFENYPKQTYRNRCHIASANGIQALTVPVEKPDTLKCLTRDVRISEHGNWRHVHWNALVSAYKTSPFFEYLEDDFRPFYEQKYDFLIDFNEALQEMICSVLDISPNIRRTTVYKSVVENDFRNVIDPRHPLSDPNFTPIPYYQVFRNKHGFLPNLSIVDLLFNMGKESIFKLY